jgi:signal transduction histidine kinase
MLVADILLAISSAISMVLGLFIIVSNPKRALNRSLFAIVLSTFLWLFANLLANLLANVTFSLFFARATLIGAALLPLTFIIFCKIYTQGRNFSTKHLLALGLPSFGLLLIFPTSLNIVSVGPNGQNTVTGSAYFLLIVFLIVYFAWGLSMLIQHYRKTHKPDEKARLLYIFWGISLTLVPVVITNAILPALLHSKTYLYGPNAILIFVAFTSIAIIRHRLLDIKLLVARSLTYLLLFVSVTAFYSLVVFVAATRIFGLNPFSERVVPIAAAIFLGLTLQPIKKFFDRLTNQFFYRDAYDSQAFLESFNRTLVSTYDLTPLLKKSASIIEENLKSNYCIFGLKETESAPQRILGTGGHPAFTPEDIRIVRSLTPHMGRRVIVTDALEEKYGQLQSILQRNNVGLIARLTSATSEEGVGYLILGTKKSGSIYSSQDLKVIEILANELVIAIQNAMRTEEIQNFNITLQQKVDEATKKLRRTNEKLRELDETKDDFISMASHQLRTPLTSVKGYISMVLEEDAGKITHMQREMLGQAFFSSQRMVYLIADLLNVSRLKTGKFVIEPARVNLAEMVQQELEQLEETAASRQLTLQYDKPATFPDLMLDETKTRQVIMNFVDNAIYYTPAGGHIVVRLIDNPQTIELRVEDNGIGVPKAEQHHLFTKFYRAGNARKARPDGTGLGLFMAKKVIIAQGGSTIFDSTEGKGSTFGFTFSKSRLSTAALQPAQAEPALTKPE